MFTKFEIDFINDEKNPKIFLHKKRNKENNKSTRSNSLERTQVKKVKKVKKVNKMCYAKKSIKNRKSENKSLAKKSPKTMSKNSSINTTPTKPIKPQKQNISKLFDIENFIINSGETKKFETEKFLIHNNITTPNFRKLTHSYYTNIHESSVKQVKHVKHKNLFLIIKFDKQRENFVIDNSNQFLKQHENISKILSSKNVEQGDLKYEEDTSDISDEFYTKLHRKFEVKEIEEREKIEKILYPNKYKRKNKFKS